ncbi:hypothetical protein Nepgr_009508 [Nepenthes gracilis]|uniref:Uncharacterized protein n=1 Tax=Nepenthes gracilis TaxID=150966 RepID=A0AAD3SAN3_NEPGR|nr:hypothetical protein Nepgr_009508 [Nepenthes gracilis]
MGPTGPPAGRQVLLPDLLGPTAGAARVGAQVLLPDLMGPTSGAARVGAQVLLPDLMGPTCWAARVGAKFYGTSWVRSFGAKFCCRPLGSDWAGPLGLAPSFVVLSDWAARVGAKFCCDLLGPTTGRAGLAPSFVARPHGSDRAARVGAKFCCDLLSDWAARVGAKFYLFRLIRRLAPKFYFDCLVPTG